MRNSTKALAYFVSLQATMAMEGVNAARTVSTIGAIKIIKFLNSENNYWYQKTSRMSGPIPNMGPRIQPYYVNYTEDVIKGDVLPIAFVAFMLTVVEKSPFLTLYVESGAFGLSTVFSIRICGLPKNPCIIKFNPHHLSKEHREQTISLLYSKKNVLKHFLFGLKKRESLSHYTY
jgi:hypothetical protein